MQTFRRHFLNEDIEDHPIVSWSNVGYKLKKSLYGLKRFPRLWYEKLKISPQDFAFKELSSCESSLEIRPRTFNVIIFICR